MSLWLLFVLVFLLTIDIPICFAPDAKFVGFATLLESNILPIVCLILALTSWIIACRIKYQWSGTMNPDYKIKEIKNENYEYLTFLTTYIIPLICIDLNNIRYVITLFVLLLLIGFIFVKMDLYYGNPTLALMSYRLYRAEIDDVDLPNGVILITKDKLSKGVSIKWIKIDEYVWIAKENKKCKPKN